jgi:hypothetical protein
MKRFILKFLIITLALSLFSCNNGNVTDVGGDHNPSQPSIDVGVDVEHDPLQPSSDFQGDHENTIYIDGELHNEAAYILDHINTDTTDLAKYVLDSFGNLEEMVTKYGVIVDVDWYDGAIYKHDKLDVWIAYYSSHDSFVVNFDEDAYIAKMLGELEVYYIDYSKIGPYTIVEDEKNAPILYLRYKLSDLFDKPVSQIRIEDFESFAEIFYSELSDSLLIRFTYDGLAITITTGSNNVLVNDCEVKIFM